MTHKHRRDAAHITTPCGAGVSLRCSLRSIGAPPRPIVPAEHSSARRRSAALKKLFLTALLISIFSIANAEPCRLGNVVCFVKFADEADAAWEHDFDYYEALFNDSEPGANSVANYFADQSYGRFCWHSTIVRAEYIDSHNRGYFKPQSDSNPEGYTWLDVLLDTRTKTLVKDVCTWLETQLDESADIDMNSDGEIDNIVLVICGNSDLSSSNMLWPANNRSVTGSLFGKKSGNYLKVFDGANGYKSLVAQKINTGVLCHEMMHTLNAFDLYTSSSSPKIEPVNVWDLMSDNQVKPQGLTAHVRSTYGKNFGDWLPASDIQTISEPGRYTVRPLSSESPEGVCFRIAPDKSKSEYFLIEYRDDSDFWDQSLPCGGLLVSRVNPSVTGNLGTSCELYIFRPGGSVSAAGKVKNAPLGPATDRLSFGLKDDADYPFYSDGTRALFSISDVAVNADGTMSFDYAEVAPDSSVADLENADAAPVIYNLQGVRLQGISEPGIYIINGKKVNIVRI